MPITYQALRNGQPISGATHATYTFIEADKAPDTVVEMAVTSTNARGRSSTVRIPLAELPVAAATPEPPLNLPHCAQETRLTGGRPATFPKAYADGQAAEMAAMMPTLAIASPTHTAVKSGAWSASATWGGAVPGNGATVRIPMGMTVTYDARSDARIKDVIVLGKLAFATDKDTKLVVDTLLGMGEFEIGTSEKPVTESGTPGKPRAHIVFDAHVAPRGTARLGFMPMGKCRIHGAAKLAFGHVIRAPKAGDTTIRFREDVSSWQVGDQLIVHGTQFAGTTGNDPQDNGPANYWTQTGTRYTFDQPAFYSGQSRDYIKTEDEERTVTAVDPQSRKVTLSAPLTYDHPGMAPVPLPNGKVKSVVPIVSNVSRSIRFESATPSGDRAHIMFMHDDDVDVRWFEAKSMGRTRSDATLVTSPSVTDNGVYAVGSGNTKGAPLADRDNVRGRYPIHFHRNGPFIARRQVNLVGASAWAPVAEPPMPGWGIVQHSARAAIEQCVVYNARGAGMVTENGDEIGHWVDNVVSYVRGDGFGWKDFGRRAEEVENHNGHAGVAYENQARQLLIQHCWASSCQYGHVWHQQNANMAKRIPDADSLRLRDPVTVGGMKDIRSYGGISYDIDEDTYGIEQAQIPDWNHNVIVAAGSGMSVAHRQFSDRADVTPGIFRGMVCLNVQTPVDIPNYSFSYSYYDFAFKGPDSNGGTAIKIGTKSFGINFVNGHVEDYKSLFSLSEVNYNGHYIDIVCTNVANTTGTSSKYSVGYPAKNHPMFGVMGGGVDLGQSGGKYEFQLRTHVVLDSARDLPTPYPLPPLGLSITGPEPKPGAAKPYFALDPSSTLELRMNAANTFSYFGTIVDRVGRRRYPDTMIATNPPGNEKDLKRRENYNATGAMIVARNGCYEAAPGKWKCRLWHVDHERLTGRYFTFPVDLTLTGSWNASFLEAHRVDPDATNPLATLPLKPEALTAVQ